MWWAAVVCALLPVFGRAEAANAQAAYPEPVPGQRYAWASIAGEVALARSAAPAAVSEKAEILVLGKSGYETAEKGTNGFVCLVQRSWGNDFDNPEFWNPKVRSPMCLNALAASSVLPVYLERTRWVLSGSSQAEMFERGKAAAAKRRDADPPAGAMCFMMSKQGYLADAVGHAHPHLMFFVSHLEAGAWGAKLPGSPVFADRGKLDPYITFFVTVPKWSDGTSGMEMAAQSHER